MIEHSNMLIKQDLDPKDMDKDEDGDFDVVQTPEPFPDDYVENTRAVDGKAHCLHKQVHNTATRRSGGDIDPADEFRNELAEQGIDIEVKDLDVLFDAEEELYKLGNDAPVVELDPQGVAEQFQDLSLWRNTETRTTAAAEENPRSESGSDIEGEWVYIEVASSENRESQAVAVQDQNFESDLESQVDAPSTNSRSVSATTVTTRSNSVQGSFAEREVDPAFLDAADVAEWDDATREIVIKMHENEDMVLGMESGSRIVSSSAPKQDLRVGTMFQHDVYTPSNLLTRRFVAHAATTDSVRYHDVSYVDTTDSALYREDDDDEFPVFEEAFVSGQDVDVSGFGGSWFEFHDLELDELDSDKSELDAHELAEHQYHTLIEAETLDLHRFIEASGISLGSLVRVVEEVDDLDDVDHLMNAQDEHQSFTVKGAKGAGCVRGYGPEIDLSDLGHLITTEHGHEPSTPEDCPKCWKRRNPSQKDVEEIPKKGTNNLERLKSEDIPDMRRDNLPDLVSYFDANTQRQTSYTALSELCKDQARFSAESLKSEE